MSFRNSTASIFRKVEHVFYEPAANDLGTIKVLILGVNSGGFISASVCQSFSVLFHYSQKSVMLWGFSQRKYSV
jgi:hypothetical protein